MWVICWILSIITLFAVANIFIFYLVFIERKWPKLHVPRIWRRSEIWFSFYCENQKNCENLVILMLFDGFILSCFREFSLRVQLCDASYFHVRKGHRPFHQQKVCHIMRRHLLSKQKFFVNFCANCLFGAQRFISTALDQFDLAPPNKRLDWTESRSVGFP